MTLSGTRLSPRGLPVLAACFLLSGAASLMDQVVWLRYLSLVFGNTTLATATLLAVFMGGLGLGSLFLGRWADRLRNPLIAYALFELAIGAFALASPKLLSGIDTAYVLLYRSWGNLPILFSVGRAALVAVFLLPPTILMGATLPLVLRFVTSHEGQVGRSSGFFYGLNTLGAVLGTALAGFVTIRYVGLVGTLYLAAAANLAAALGSFAVSRPVSTIWRRPLFAGDGPSRKWLWSLFFAMGATSLAYEVLWTRILVFHLGSSVYAYSLMLLLVLLGIGVGSLMAAPWADRLGSGLAVLTLVELGIGLWTPIQARLFENLDLLLLTFAELLPPGSVHGVAFTRLLALLPIIGPSAVLMGVSFPLAVRAISRDPGRVGTDVGQVYGANTLGAVVGSLVAGFVLIPFLGTQNALLAVGAANAAIGTILAFRAFSPLAGLLFCLAPALVLLATTWLEPNRVILSAGMFRHDGPENLVYFHEDVQASVTIRELEKDNEPYLSLEVNGVIVAGTSPELYAAQKMQGHLPLLLSREPGKVVHIGFGSGGTAWAVSRHPVDEIRIVEISPEVLSASDRFFRDINHGVLEDKRTRVEINDGRNFLLATPERFQNILSDSIHPCYAGNGSLYSLEYFRLIRDRLEPGGVASMWLPTYFITPHNYAMILRAFRDVFPYVTLWYEATTVNAFTIVTGSMDQSAWRPEVVQRAFESPVFRNEVEDLGITGPADIVAMLMATSNEIDPWLENVVPHTDDRPAVEYESAALLDRNAPWLTIFDQLIAIRPEEPPQAFLRGLPPEEQERARTLFRERLALLKAHRQFLANELQRLSLESSIADPR